LDTSPGIARIFTRIFMNAHPFW